MFFCLEVFCAGLENCLIVRRVLYSSQIQHLTTATLLWLFTRHDVHRSFKPVVSALLVATAYKGLWLDGTLRLLATGPWLALAFKALATASMGVASLHIYSGLAQSIGI